MTDAHADTTLRCWLLGHRVPVAPEVIRRGVSVFKKYECTRCGASWHVPLGGDL